MWAGVKAEDINLNWGMFEPLVENVLEHTRGEMSTRDVLCELLAGNWQLWVVGADSSRWGICITHVYDNYQRRFCELVMVSVRPGYTFKEMRAEFDPILCEWALAHDCDALRMITSRKGLRAAVGPEWKEVYVEMERPLCPAAATRTQSRQSPPTNPGADKPHS